MVTTLTQVPFQAHGRYVAQDAKAAVRLYDNILCGIKPQVLPRVVVAPAVTTESGLCKDSLRLIIEIASQIQAFAPQYRSENPNFEVLREQRLPITIICRVGGAWSHWSGEPLDTSEARLSQD